MRLDVALYELRLFKSRSLASRAITDGDVLLNGERSKSSRPVHPGDRVTLATAAGRKTMEILGLPSRSLTKDAARALLRETGEE
jgi:ribosome-associated heat shock protein Hsp15